MKPLGRIRWGAAVALVVTSCASGAPPPTAPSAHTGPAEVGSGHDIVMQATSCWMGGLWSDALGERGDERFARIEHRCDALLRSVVGPGDDYYPLRAVEPRMVGVLAQKVQAAAEQNPTETPHARELVALLRMVADTMRETIEARRAADVVKENVTEQPQIEIRNAAKVAAAAKLQASGALDALLRFDAGPFTDEAHAIAVLTAVDRMEIARGLPKHLKVYAVQTAYGDVFGVAAPALPRDAAAPIPTGTWLAYLSDVAVAAGHPVPGDAHDPQNREPLAWTGVLQGFADRLRADTPRLATGTPLGDVERAVVARLEEEYRNERVVYEAHAPADR
jgi:hypothetical protein